MEFRNLTPFNSLAYNAFNVHDEELHVVAIKVAYRMVPGGGQGLTHRCEVATGVPQAKLRSSDVYDGELNLSSVRGESDLAPFKPRCDVLVRATAHAPQGRPAERWTARMRVSSSTGALVDKSLEVCGPRRFERSAGAWTLTAPQPATEVPVRWERAFGGRSFVAHPEHTEAAPRDPLLNEVCTSNPIGAGWMERRYEDALTRAGLALPEHLPAPQIEAPDARVAAMVIAAHPNHGLNAKEMAAQAERYGCRPQGLGPVGRAWAPRLAKAGTYDEAWVRDRHPFLPDDFSFGYWNAAPEDQQIEHPAPGAPLRFELWNLTAPAHSVDGCVSFELPPHRAFAMLWMRGLPVPLSAVIDTIDVDAEAMMTTCVWRALAPRTLAVSRIEARFEVDPNAPLLKLEVGVARG